MSGLVIPTATVGRQLHFADASLNQEIDRLYAAIQQRHAKISPRQQLEHDELANLVLELVQPLDWRFVRTVALESGLQFKDQRVGLLGAINTTSVTKLVAKTGVSITVPSIADGASHSQSIAMDGVEANTSVILTSAGLNGWQMSVSPDGANVVRFVATNNTGGAQGFTLNNVTLLSINVSED